MYLFVIDHPYHYEAENLCRVFFPFDKVVTLRDPAEAGAPQARTVSYRAPVRSTSPSAARRRSRRCCPIWKRWRTAAARSA